MFRRGIKNFNLIAKRKICFWTKFNVKLNLSNIKVLVNSKNINLKPPKEKYHKPAKIIIAISTLTLLNKHRKRGKHTQQEEDIQGNYENTVVETQEHEFVKATLLGLSYERKRDKVRIENSSSQNLIKNQIKELKKDKAISP